MKAPGPSWFELLKESFSEETRDEHYWCLEYPLKLTARYGEVIYISARKQFVLTGAQGFEHVLKTNHHQYQRDPVYYQSIMFPFFGNSILVNEGSLWKNRRKIAQPFYQQSKLLDYVPTFAKLTQNFINDLQKYTPPPGLRPPPFGKGRVGGIFAGHFGIDILSAMNRLTLNIASQLMCGLQFKKSILKKFESEIAFCNWHCSHAPFQFGLKLMIDRLRFRYKIYHLEKRLLKIIQNRRENPTDSNDLLNRLLNTPEDPQLDNPQTLTDNQVLHELKTHLITGHETTACSLAWLWSLIAEHPEYQQQLIAEVDSVLNGRTITSNDIPKLPLTRAIVLETFRLYPPIWNIPRSNQEPDNILGIQIPAKSSLLLNIYSLHHNPDYWPNPEVFDPSRFLNPDPNRHPFAYLPFGGAGHLCIANHFAPLEMIVLVATIAQHLRFEKLKKSTQNRARALPCISLKPHNGLRLIPRPR